MPYPATSPRTAGTDVERAAAGAQEEEPDERRRALVPPGALAEAAPRHVPRVHGEHQQTDHGHGPAEHGIPRRVSAGRWPAPCGQRRPDGEARRREDSDATNHATTGSTAHTSRSRMSVRKTRSMSQKGGCGAGHGQEERGVLLEEHALPLADARGQGDADRNDDAEERLSEHERAEEEERLHHQRVHHDADNPQVGHVQVVEAGRTRMRVVGPGGTVGGSRCARPRTPRG